MLELASSHVIVSKAHHHSCISHPLPYPIMLALKDVLGFDPLGHVFDRDELFEK